MTRVRWIRQFGAGSQVELELPSLTELIYILKVLFTVAHKSLPQFQKVQYQYFSGRVAHSQSWVLQVLNSTLCPPFSDYTNHLHVILDTDIIHTPLPSSWKNARSLIILIFISPNYSDIR